MCINVIDSLAQAFGMNSNIIQMKKVWENIRSKVGLMFIMESKVCSLMQSNFFWSEKQILKSVIQLSCNLLESSAKGLSVSYKEERECDLCSVMLDSHFSAKRYVVQRNSCFRIFIIHSR